MLYFSCARKVVKLLLNVNHLSSSSLELPQEFAAVTDDGLPQPSAHLLLQPLIKVLPFPPYFSELFSFLCEIKQYNDRMASEVLKQTKFSDYALTSCQWAEIKIKMTAAEVKKLLPKLNEEGFDLVLPYLKETFESPHTSVLAAWYLFNMVAQAMGPQLTCKHLIQPLTRLFDAEYPTTKHMKLYHHSYLLQLIIRLGLQTFLAHFTTLLVEAVGGYKDFGGRRDSKYVRDRYLFF